MGMEQMLDVARNLGTPGVAFVSLAIVIIWLAHQTLSLRRELRQSQEQSVNSLIKVWTELEEKRPRVQDPNFEAIRQEILYRLGVGKVAPFISTLEQYLLSFLGASVAQGIRIWLVLKRIPDVNLALLLVVYATIALLSMVLAKEVVGRTAERSTYIAAGLLTGLALPYLLFTIWRLLQSN